MISGPPRAAAGWAGRVDATRCHCGIEGVSADRALAQYFVDGSVAVACCCRGEPPLCNSTEPMFPFASPHFPPCPDRSRPSRIDSLGLDFLRGTGRPGNHCIKSLHQCFAFPCAGTQLLRGRCFGRHGLRGCSFIEGPMRRQDNYWRCGGAVWGWLGLGLINWAGSGTVEVEIKIINAYGTGCNARQHVRARCVVSRVLPLAAEVRTGGGCC